MEPQYFKILVFGLWFLLPLAPAYILYKFLPENQVAVKGPFKGLTVDMAGAFAGYFLLFLGSYIIVKGLLFEKKPDSEVWTIKGTALDEHGRRIDAICHKPDVIVYPPMSINNGVIDFPIPVKVDGNSYDFPRISITATSLDNGGGALTISSETYNDFFDPDVVKGHSNGNWRYDFERRIIKYDVPIKLSKAPTDSDRFVNAVAIGPNSVEIDSLKRK